MQYRVLKVGEQNYVPQYKSWWTFGWRSFKEYWGYGTTSFSFFTEDFAIEYCKKKIKAKEPEKVVWESNPDYCNHFGPE
jgi:hypothetical protein